MAKHTKYKILNTIRENDLELLYRSTQVKRQVLQKSFLCSLIKEKDIQGYDLMEKIWGKVKSGPVEGSAKKSPLKS